MGDNDDDLCIPRSAMYKLVKEIVPQVRLSGEAKNLIVTACNEFIHLLASESNNVCERQSKKLILPDHVLAALDNLGFSEYKDDCVEGMKQMQEETDKRKELRNKLKNPGIPEEELKRKQNMLFAEARQQQMLIDNANEWSRVQQEAQMALQRQASVSNGVNGNMSNNNNNNSNNNGSNHNAFNSTSHFAATFAAASSNANGGGGGSSSYQFERTMSITSNPAAGGDCGNNNNNDDDDDNYD